MSPVAMWLPFEVTDLDAAKKFYIERVGLAAVDGWNRNGERGVVLRAGGAAFVELVEGRRPVDPPLALELAGASQVDAQYAALRPHEAELAERISKHCGRSEPARSGHDGEPITPPHYYPRGHYGFEVRGPAGATIMLWSERS